jgi:hypothetical protein
MKLSVSASCPFHLLILLPFVPNLNLTKQLAFILSVAFASVSVASPIAEGDKFPKHRHHDVSIEKRNISH